MQQLRTLDQANSDVANAAARVDDAMRVLDDARARLSDAMALRDRVVRFRAIRRQFLASFEASPQARLENSHR